MKTLLVTFAISLLSFTTTSKYVDDYCTIYGIIYFESNKFKADAIVYFQEDETQADLLVIKEESRLFADEEGVWYITDNPALANYKLHITKDQRMSDFSFHYIEDRAFVGCQ